MPTVEEYTDPYLSTYTYVPPAGPNVCTVCHTAVEGTYRRCYSCNQSIAQVSRPALVVVPISLYRGLEQLHHVLRQYKPCRRDLGLGYHWSANQRIADRKTSTRSVVLPREPAVLQTGCSSREGAA